MRLFDTKKRDYIEWQPPETVRMYVCGITPYDAAHIGHIFTFMTYDLIQRRLQDAGHTVNLVRNVTDVDEPIYKRAAELDMSYMDLAAQETASFQQTMQALNFVKPAHEPLASQYIDPIAKAVGRLLESKHAYFVDGDIYFDTTTIPDFGKVNCFNERLRMGLFKKRGGDPTRPGKRNPLDFLLWKAINDPSDPAAWEVGNSLPKGRPGWHIECTVMSENLLGVPFDLHGGGNDLIFPHHEAEIAQSVALNDQQPAQLWTHTAPMLYGGEKMSKSLGNLVFAADLLQEYSADAIRLSLMHYHYREGGEWIPAWLDDATRFLELLKPRIDTAGHDSGAILLETIRAALDDDLDTHAVLHALLDFVRAPSGDGDGADLARQATSLIGLKLD